MNIKKPALLIILLLSIPLFSQKNEDKGIGSLETKVSYLDSIKKTFINDNIASCVDSLWMKELSDLEIYNEISNDVENINTDEKVDYELPTELLKSRLEALNAKSPFTIEYNQSLENVIKGFLKNRKKSFGKLMGISEYYFPMFEEAFAKQNIPLEIKYLAIVESALNPKAVSRVGATGLWQFMYQTGKQYNLKIDSYIDERSDPLKSTEAAAQYMSNMYNIFGDWELVLASYNSGPGNVAKAIRRSGGKQNYWSIRKNLPKETQGYVPAFLATMYLYEYRKEHGIIPDRPNIQHFETDTIMIRQQMSFKQISDLLDISVSELQLLNPTYKRNVIPTYNDHNYYLRLPKDKIAIFTSNEDKIYGYLNHELNLNNNPFISSNSIANNGEETTYEKSTKTKFYKIKRGDNLGFIANNYNVSIAELKRWNNLKSNAITAGRTLKIITTEITSTKIKSIPKTEVASVTKSDATLEKTKKEVIQDSLSIEDELIYIVQRGDNLNAIAQKNNVTVAQIKEWNNLNGNTIQIGASLLLGEKKSNNKATQEQELKNIEYTVQKGDNLGNISKKFGTTVENLKEWNQLADNNIKLGTVLIVTKNEIAIKTDLPTVSSYKKNISETTKNQEINYYVQKGDSLYSIAKKYPGVSVSDIKKWNDIKNEDIKPGMKLKIGG